MFKTHSIRPITCQQTHDQQYIKRTPPQAQSPALTTINRTLYRQSKLTDNFDFFSKFCFL